MAQLFKNAYPKVIKQVIHLFLIFIVLFLVLEIFQRCRYAYRIKDIEYLYYGFKMPKKLIYIKDNAFFREPFNILKEGKNVLFIGGSSTYGAYNDNFHTFPYLLQSKLNGVSCLNAGRRAMLSDSYLGILKRCCKEFCIPEMVIFYTGFNDIFCVPVSDSKLYKYLNNKLMGRLEKYSFLLLTVREKLVIQEQLKKRKDFKYRIRFVKKFEKNIEECVKFAKSKNISVVLIPEVLIAEEFSVNPTNDYRWYREIYLEIPKAIKNVAQKHNCSFLNPKNVLYANWKENFADPVHLTDKGNKALTIFLLHNLNFERISKGISLSDLMR